MTDSIALWKDLRPRLVAVGPERVFTGVEFNSRGPRRWRGRCPLHNGSNKSSFVVNVETLGFRCWACGAEGSPLAFMNGGEEPSGERFAELLQEAAELAGVDLALEVAARRPRAARPPRPAPRPRPERPAFPPRDEVEALWHRCLPVEADDEAMAWALRRLLPAGVEDRTARRGWLAAALEDRQLARVAPRGLRCPAWARFRGPWSEGAWRLVVPLADCQGRLRSLHARAIAPRPEDTPKALSPVGFTTKGLVMADPLGRRLLGGEPLPWWPPDRELELVVVEGATDFLNWSVEHGDADPCAPAVLGVIGGGASTWSAELADRVPDGAVVYLRTDPDGPGERYAEAIASTLIERCDVRRRTSHGLAA